MPNLCIIPFRSLQDTDLSHADLRILCAIGSHTDRDGAGVWASAKTLSDEAVASRSQFFASCAKLEARGYITRTARWSTSGRQMTSMMRVLLDEQPVQRKLEGRVQRLLDGESPEATGHKRPQGTTPKNKPQEGEREAVQSLYDTYPAREGANPYLPAQTAIVALLRQGIPVEQLLRAQHGYTDHVRREHGLPSKFVRMTCRFYADDFWREYDRPTVYGRTREEWARSGQDVEEFDRTVAIQGAGMTVEINAEDEPL
jgi:hypothetical protein